MSNSYNKHSLGNAKEKRMEAEERRNPMAMITRLLNVYHSLDLSGRFTEAQKPQLKVEINNEIMRLIKYISKDQHGMIKSCIKNKDLWDIHKEKM